MMNHEVTLTTGDDALCSVRKSTGQNTPVTRLIIRPAEPGKVGSVETKKSYNREKIVISLKCLP